VLPRTLGPFKPDALILVTLDLAHMVTVELQVRQLRRRLPGVKVGVAQWPGAGEAAIAPTPKNGADFIATGMEQIFANAFGKVAPDAATA
jgi:hypothetical protein